jgi:hypothetical protein
VADLNGPDAMSLTWDAQNRPHVTFVDGTSVRYATKP